MAGSTPSVWTILAKVNKVTAKRKAVHGVGTSTYWSARKTSQGTVSYTDKGRFIADADTTNTGSSTVRERITHTRKGVSASYTLDYSTTGSIVAARVEPYKKWSCGSTNIVLNSIDVWTPNTFWQGMSKASAAISGAHVKLLGSTAYHGRAVWKIFTLIAKVDHKTKATERTTTTTLVDKSTYLVPYFASSEQVKEPSSQFALTSSVALTKYGEALPINMHGC